MEEELRNFIKVWLLAAAGLTYCYYIASKIPKGLLRIISVLPVFYLFTIPALSLTSFCFTAITALFMVWLANFKLLLFCFEQPPLYPLPPKLFHFISLTLLPIKFKQNPSNKNPKSSQKLTFTKLAIEILLLLLLLRIHKYKDVVPWYVIFAVLCLQIYVGTEGFLTITALIAETLSGFQLEPQFNKPYLSTSLQDFWGRRWNLMVTTILRSTIYLPIRRCVSCFFGPVWAALAGVLATFLVSGLMHELNYYYISRQTPTGKMTSFFVLHGVSVAAEVAVKQMVKARWNWKLHVAVSRVLTLGYVIGTATWLYVPVLMSNNLEEKLLREYSNISVKFVNQFTS